LNDTYIQLVVRIPSINLLKLHLLVRVSLISYIHYHFIGVHELLTYRDDCMMGSGCALFQRIEGSYTVYKFNVRIPYSITKLDWWKNALLNWSWIDENKTLSGSWLDESLMEAGLMKNFLPK